MDEPNLKWREIQQTAGKVIASILHELKSASPDEIWQHILNISIIALGQP